MNIQYFLSETTEPLSDDIKAIYATFNPNQYPIPLAVMGKRQLVRGIVEKEDDLKQLVYLLAISGKEVSIVLAHLQDGTAVVDKKPEYDEFFAQTQEITDEKGIIKTIPLYTQNTGGGWIFPWDKVEEVLSKEMIIP